MLKEFLGRAYDLGRAACPLRVLRVPGEPAHLYRLVRPDGSADVHECEPAPRAHAAMDLDTVVRLVRAFAGWDSPAAVWYSRDGVTALLDDSTRRDRVTCLLPVSPQLARLRALDYNPVWMPQAEAVRLLRVELHPGVTDAVVDGLRRADLASAQPWTDWLSALVPVFGGWPHSFLVDCAVDVDPAARAVAVTPLPGAVEEAVRRAEASVGAYLTDALAEDEHVHVYYGRP